MNEQSIRQKFYIFRGALFPPKYDGLQPNLGLIFDQKWFKTSMLSVGSNQYMVLVNTAYYGQQETPLALN